MIKSVVIHLLVRDKLKERGVVVAGFFPSGEEKNPPCCVVGRADMTPFQWCHSNINGGVIKGLLCGVWRNCKMCTIYNCAGLV